MHILLITFEFPPQNAIGGIGSYMYSLSRILAASGNKVTVISGDPKANSSYRLEKSNIINYLLPSQSNESFKLDVLDFFDEYYKSNQVDVIESPEVGACALLIKKKYPLIPLIVKMHSPGVLITRVNNTYISFYKKMRFVIGALKKGKIDLGHWSNFDKNYKHDPEYQICLEANTLLSPSIALKRWSTRFWKIPSSKIELLQNPFYYDENLFGLPINNRPLTICFIGKLSILKGMIAFTDAIPLILKKNINCRVIIVGRDEIEKGRSMQAYMQKKLKDYSSQILFTGALAYSNLIKIYAESKVCIFPSLWENFPTVIMEAMAAGAAVAASNRGGIPEIIENGKNGILFDPSDSRKIAKAVNLLLENEHYRIKIATTARTYLKDNIRSYQNHENLLSVYTKYDNQKK